jgi:outer membrane protein insertion porin family
VRQLEGGYLSNALVDRSKVLIQRLPYVEKVEEKSNPVPGSPDLVDVDFDIKEGLPGQFGGSLGFSETYGVTLGGQFIHSNFMGTGKRVALQVTGGKYQKIFDANFTDPYRNIDGVARSLQLTYQHLTQFTSVSSQFSTTTLNGGMTWGYPITDYQSLRFGYSYQDAELVTSTLSSQQAVDWVTHNGKSFRVSDFVVGTRIKSLELVAGWSYDSRNASLFPTRGTRAAVSLNTSVPGSDVEYYVAALNFQKYIPLGNKWRVRLNSELSYGDAFGSTTSLPPFRNRFGGGPGSVRGFKESYLGPRDNLGNPYGGNIVVSNQLELLIPTPAKISGSTRVALFYDLGGVFSNGVKFYDKLGDPIDYSFKYDRLKRSVGLGVEWLAPLGLLRFSYAVPLNEQPATDRYFGDLVERFQFSVGNAF